MGAVPSQFPTGASSTHQHFFKRGLHSSPRAYLPAGDVLSKLISGYIKAGQAREAVKLYYRVQEDGASLLSVSAITAALKACISIPDLQAGKRIHAHAIEIGQHTNLRVASAVVDMYAKCGSADDARLAFEAMRHRDVVSWNAMIAGYARLGMHDSAARLFLRMQDEGFAPNSRTFVDVIRACAATAAARGGTAADPRALRMSCLEWGKVLHAQLMQQGLESNELVASALVDMYAECGSISDARSTFESMARRRVVSWTAMIMGYVKLERGDLALDSYACMRSKGLMPNMHTFVAALKACGSLMEREGRGADSRGLKAISLERGRAIHAELSRRGFESDIVVANALLDMYTKCGSMGDACRVFQNMTRRNVVSWTVMIMGYAQMEMGHSALKLYARMRNEGIEPNARTFVAALTGCSTVAAQEEGITADHSGRLRGNRFLEQGRAVHAELARRGLESNVYVASALVDMYVSCRSIEDARQVFEGMSDRSVVSWNAMIMGYTKMEMGSSAIKLYARMQREGFVPDAHTFVAALKACGGLAALETGKLIHSQVRSAGLQRQPIIATCLVDMYCKCGSVMNARHVFDSLLARDSAVWNALLAGYGGQGDGECSFDLYRRMLDEGIKPDGVTFVSVLALCSRNGLVSKGRMYFRAMCFEHAIPPSNRHYRCMADLLGRAGDLDDAIDMVTTMPFEPDSVTWITVLGACRKWSNVGTGRHAFESAVMFNARATVAYVLMTNIYVSSRMWEESARIEAMRKNAQGFEGGGRRKWINNSGIVQTCFEGGLKDPSATVRGEEYTPDSDMAPLRIFEDGSEDVCGCNAKVAVSCPPGSHAAGSTDTNC